MPYTKTLGMVQVALEGLAHGHPDLRVKGETLHDDRRAGGIERALTVAKQMKAVIDATPTYLSLHVVHLGEVCWSGTERE
jgi:hypothetical protein